MSFKIDRCTFSEILSSYARIVIPSYQRDYDWSENEWKDLWRDLQDGVGGTDDYFIGPLNAERLPSGDGIQIADGQQRLTSLSILLSALRNFLDASRHQEVNDLLFAGSNVNPIQQRPTRLLDEANNGTSKLLKVFLASGAISPDEVESKHDKAFNFFSEQLSPLTPLELNSLLDLVLNRVVFARVVAQDAGSGIKMFERANTRGRPLTFTDKLKSLLIGSATQAEAHVVISNWAETVKNLRSIGKYDDRRFVDWLNADFGDDDKSVRASEALALARSVVMDNVLECSNQLLSYSSALARIWTGKTPKGNHDCGSLHNLLNFSRFSQLLRVLPAARNLPEESFVRLAHEVESTVCVVAIAKAFPPDIERLLPNLLKISRQVRDGDAKFEVLLAELRAIRNHYAPYFGDRIVNGTLADFKRPYLLTLWGVLDHHMANANRNRGAKIERPAIKLSEMSIEHVLAKSPNARASSREYGAHHAPHDKQRFANLTPLEKGLNYGANPYSDKKRSYVNSNFLLTKTMSPKFVDAGLKSFREMRKKYLPAYRSWSREQLLARSHRLHALSSLALDFVYSKAEERSPDSPTLESLQLLPRVSSFSQLVDQLQSVADGGRPPAKFLSTLRFLGVIDDVDGDDAITDLGEDVLKAPNGERAERLRIVAKDVPYLLVWSDMTSSARDQLLRRDFASIFGADKPTVRRQVQNCLTSWSTELFS